MKILIITSSFRKKGNTAQLVDLLRQKIQEISVSENNPAEFEIINLAERNIQYCHGCRVCFDKGESFCPYWDDIAPIKSAMKSADVFVLASPVYVEDVNGVMKTFLDRLAHINHRPEFAGKYAFLLTTSGSGSSGHAARTMASTMRTWGVHIIGQRDFVAGALSTSDELSTRHRNVIEKIARQIISSVEKKKAQTPSFISLVYFKVQQYLWQRNVEDSIDFHYWESKGWINRGVTYYFPHRANRLKVASARLAGRIIAGFFD
jgi:multimeric flavodoxin WrbA